jgi:hypothetical protein
LDGNVEKRMANEVDEHVRPEVREITGDGRIRV